MKQHILKSLRCENELIQSSEYTRIDICGPFFAGPMHHSEMELRTQEAFWRPCSRQCMTNNVIGKKHKSFMSVREAADDVCSHSY